MQESGRNILRPVIMRSTAVSGLSFVHGHNLCSPENWWKKISIQRREKEREKGEEIAMLHEARSFLAYLVTIVTRLLLLLLFVGN